MLLFNKNNQVTINLYNLIVFVVLYWFLLAEGQAGMSENEELLTVTQVVKLTGKSAQYFYSEMRKKDGRFSNYITTKNNKKYLKYSVLKDVFGIDNPAIDSPGRQRDDTKDNNEEIIQLLKDQLAEKDRQIEKLTKLLDQQQQLHAQDIKRLEEKQAEPKQRKRLFSWFRRGKSK